MYILPANLTFSLQFSLKKKCITDLAESIARRYKYLINLKDEDGMTALQLLACNPSAFKSGSEHGFLKRLLFSCIVYFPFYLLVCSL